MRAWHVVLPMDELPEATPRAAIVADELVLLVRHGQDVAATQGVCPHKFGPLADGTLHGWNLTCPVHAATFDLRSGAALPGGVWSGPLRTFPARVREGMVEVALG